MLILPRPASSQFPSQQRIHTPAAAAVPPPQCSAPLIDRSIASCGAAAGGFSDVAEPRSSAAAQLEGQRQASVAQLRLPQRLCIGDTATAMSMAWGARDRTAAMSHCACCPGRGTPVEAPPCPLPLYQLPGTSPGWCDLSAAQAPASAAAGSAGMRARTRLVAAALLLALACCPDGGHARRLRQMCGGRGHGPNVAHTG